MKAKEFNELLESRLAKIREVLNSKGKEYSTNENKMHNFNRAAIINRESREKAAWGMATKHLVSVLDIIDNTDKGIYPTKEVIDEKFGDLINYLILIEISLKEEATFKEEENE